jgi:hypothetical protein
MHFALPANNPVNLIPHIDPLLQFKADFWKNPNPDFYKNPNEKMSINHSEGSGPSPGSDRDSRDQHGNVRSEVESSIEIQKTNNTSTLQEGGGSDINMVSPAEAEILKIKEKMKRNRRKHIRQTNNKKAHSVGGRQSVRSGGGSGKLKPISLVRGGGVVRQIRNGGSGRQSGPRVACGSCGRQIRSRVTQSGRGGRVRRGSNKVTQSKRKVATRNSKSKKNTRKQGKGKGKGKGKNSSSTKGKRK